MRASIFILIAAFAPAVILPDEVGPIDGPATDDSECSLVKSLHKVEPVGGGTLSWPVPIQSIESIGYFEPVVLGCPRTAAIKQLSSPMLI